MKILMRLVATVVIAGLCALPVMAQTSSASITGHVADQTGGAVPNASVRLIDEQTRAHVFSTNTNTKGDFSFASVAPGTYTVVVSDQGYKELRKVGLVLFAAVNLDAGTFVLQVGTVAQSVTVEADITALQTTSSERSAVLDTTQIDNLLAVGRDVMSMTKVMPGVVENSDGAGSLSTTTAPVVNGVNNEYSLTQVDGVISNTRGLATMDTPINLDAVKEVTVNQGNYQAQYGGEAGGNFSFVTKNGTSQFHGGVYYYFRNEDLNANPFFDKYGLTPDKYKPRPLYRYNVAGGTIGGPIFWPGHFNRNRNKLFFFVSVEDSPIKSPDGLKNYMVPTQLEAKGDFSQTHNQGVSSFTSSNLVNIAYPGRSKNSGGGTCPTNGATTADCFPGNLVTAPYVNAQTLYLLQLMYNSTLAKYPQNAYTNLAVSNNNYNYQTNWSADKPVNQEIFRIDYVPSEKLHMFFRGDLTVANDDDFQSPANTMSWLLKVNYQLGEPNYVYNIVYAFTPTLVNEFNIGTAGWRELQLYNSSDLAQVTLSSNGFNLPSLYSGVNPMNLYPATTFGGTNIPNYGWDSRFPMVDQVRSYNATDKVTKVWGNHTFVVGIDAGTDAYAQPSHNRVGNFNFSVNSSNPNDTNWMFSNAATGVLYQYSQTTKLNTYDPRTNRLEWYYQDTWKMFRNFTLEFGIRNSWAMAQKNKTGDNFVPELYNVSNAPILYQYGFDSTGKQVAVDPTTSITHPLAYAGLMVPGTGNLDNGILYVNTQGYPQGTTYGNGILQAPRVGFAWSVMPNTVIRANFGLFYNVRARSGQEGDLTNNAPTTNSATQYYSSATSTAPNYYASAGISNLNAPFTIGHGLPLHGSIPYAEETSLGVQQQLPFDTVLDVAYVGTFTKHASETKPINEVPYGAEFLQNHQYCSAVSGGNCTKSSTMPDNFFRPYPGFNNISQQYFDLTANYNALQVKVTRRFHNGLEFGGAYTWGRAMDYIDSYNGGGPLYQNIRQWQYGPAGWDLKHMLVTNYVYALPRASRAFGGNSGWNNVATRTVLDGWQISGFITYYSGAPPTSPVSLSVSGNPNITGGGDGARVVLTCDPWKPVHGTRTFKQWFNTACFGPPIAGSTGQVATTAHPNGVTPTFYSTGNGVFSGKVDYFLPGNTNFETALIKNLPIENKFRLQLRVETYNTFNHTQFNAVNNTAFFANATTQTGNPQTSSTFGQLSGTPNNGQLGGPRTMQLALRIDF
jgi:Carboxypeptidase regulatory-like domain